MVRGGLSVEGVVYAFTGVTVGNWHPLTMLSHMLDCQLFGAKDSGAGGHHLVNLALHVANTLLLFIALRCMTGAVWRSGLVAALFGLHPLHVESVAWISERKDVLSTFFFLLVLLAYHHYAAAADAAALRGRVRASDIGTDVQTDAGHHAVCALAAGLLAAGTNEAGSRERGAGKGARSREHVLLSKQ